MTTVVAGRSPKAGEVTTLCEPAVMAELGQKVAAAQEYQAMATPTPTAGALGARPRYAIKL